MKMDQFEDKKISWGERPDFGNPSGTNAQSIHDKLNLPDDVMRNEKKPRNVMAFLVVGLFILVGIFLLFRYGLNQKPGFYDPTEKWNKFENSEYSFSYPKGTKVSRIVVAPGATEETQVIFKIAGSVVFDIAKLDPKLYNNVPANEALQSYAQGVLAYNEARPKDSKSKANSEKDTASSQTDYSCIPDSKKDQMMRSTSIDGNIAYAFELFCAYQGPEGEYQLLNSVASPDATNKYFHPANSPDGGHTYYYVEHNGSIYQIRFNYLNDNRDDTSPGNVGQNILQTFKFK